MLYEVITGGYDQQDASGGVLFDEVLQPGGDCFGSVVFRFHVLSSPVALSRWYRILPVGSGY